MCNGKLVAAATMILLAWLSRTSASTTTIYTDRIAWENALGGLFLTEDFNDGLLADGISVESSESGHVNPAGGYYQDVLASESQNEPASTWTFVPQITAYGGNWRLGGPGGSGNSLQVYIADSSALIGAIPSSFGGEFWGFVSDSPFSSVTLVGGAGSNQQTYQLDDMVYAYAVTAPGDFDGDGDVDGRDFLLWQRASSPDPLSSGDLADWQTHYGASSSVAVAAVPEPARLAPIACLFAIVMAWQRRRQLPG